MWEQRSLYLKCIHMNAFYHGDVYALHQQQSIAFLWRILLDHILLFEGVYDRFLSGKMMNGYYCEIILVGCASHWISGQTACRLIFGFQYFLLLFFWKASLIVFNSIRYCSHSSVGFTCCYNLRKAASNMMNCLIRLTECYALFLSMLGFTQLRVQYL